MGYNMTNIDYASPIPTPNTKPGPSKQSMLGETFSDCRYGNVQSLNCCKAITQKLSGCKHTP